MSKVFVPIMVDLGKRLNTFSSDSLVKGFSSHSFDLQNTFASFALFKLKRQQL